MTDPGNVTAAHLDCTAGVAGDMLLGALLGAGADLDAVRRALRPLGADVAAGEVRRAGLRCLHARVRAPAVGSPDTVVAALDALQPAAARYASAVLDQLETAGAATVGLASVLGCAAACADLGLLADGARVTCSPLAAGAPGQPVPGQHTPESGQHAPTAGIHAPGAGEHARAGVVLEIARWSGIALTTGDLPGERTTPTGAALVAVLARPGPSPAMVVHAVGSGAGARDTPERPNLTRLVLGRPADDPGRSTGTVLRVESTVDDLDPQLWPSVLAALRAAGAWDCWTSPTTGRHGRPGRVVTALGAEDLRAALVDVLLRHTGTLGVRWSIEHRVTRPRVTVVVPVGPPGRQHSVTVKATIGADGPGTAKAELADAERVAAALGWPVRTVCDAALRVYWERYPDGAPDAPGWSSLTRAVEPPASPRSNSHDRTVRTEQSEPRRRPRDRPRDTGRDPGEPR